MRGTQPACWGRLGEILEQICDKADGEIKVRFLSPCGLSLSSIPPLARVVFLIFDNDEAFEIFVIETLPATEINLRSIYPSKLLSFGPASDTKDQHSKHIGTVRYQVLKFASCSWTMTI